MEERAVSNDDDKQKKIIGLKIHLTECDRGGLHVTNVEPIDDTAVVYDAPGSDEILTSSRVGWSRPYAANWERNFGQQTQVDETN
jgi:hypothetical protein